MTTEAEGREPRHEGSSSNREFCNPTFRQGQSQAEACRQGLGQRQRDEAWKLLIMKLTMRHMRVRTANHNQVGLHYIIKKVNRISAHNAGSYRSQFRGRKGMDEVNKKIFPHFVCNWSERQFSSLPFCWQPQQ